MRIKINKNLFFDPNEPPLLIAEISGNHNGNKKKFLEHILQANKSGADLVKIQTYEPSDITINQKLSQFKIKEGIWKGNTLWNLYKKAHTPFDWHKEAFSLAKKNKIKIFSTPFSVRSLDFLKKFKPEIYKISSFEITDLKLIDAVAKTRKPIILSTGMASINEIKNAKKIINKYHNKIVIMYCVSGYPTPIDEVNIKTIENFKNIFNTNLIGLSDHTNNIYSSVAASTLGVVAIEKHFKISNSIVSHDSSFSINSGQLKNLKEFSSMVQRSMGRDSIVVKKSEKQSLKFRRSIYAIKDIKKGETFTLKNIQTFRPNIGLTADNYFKIIGKRSKKNIKKLSVLPKVLIK